MGQGARRLSSARNKVAPTKSPLKASSLPQAKGRDTVPTRNSFPLRLKPGSATGLLTLAVFRALQGAVQFSWRRRFRTLLGYLRSRVARCWGLAGPVAPRHAFSYEERESNYEGY
jgi:hypothetical protein